MAEAVSVDGEPDFDGRVALVAGASGGIGSAVAATLAARGATVALTARDRTALAAIATDIADSTGRRTVPLPADLTGPDQPQRVVDDVLGACGRLDVVVSATSVFVPTGGLRSTDLADLIAAFHVKLFGPLALIRAAATPLASSGEGAVVLLGGSSVHYPAADTLVTSTVNAAVLAATRTLAAELAPAVRVVAVSPGPTRTGRWDMFVAAAARQAGESPEQAEERLLRRSLLGRVTEPAEVAETVAFLASARARIITGTEVLVDGGRRHI